MCWLPCSVASLLSCGLLMRGRQQGMPLKMVADHCSNATKGLLCHAAPPPCPCGRANVQPDPSERADHPLSNQANLERQAGGS